MSSDGQTPEDHIELQEVKNGSQEKNSKGKEREVNTHDGYPCIPSNDFHPPIHGPWASPSLESVESFGTAKDYFSSPGPLDHHVKIADEMVQHNDREDTEAQLIQYFTRPNLTTRASTAISNMWERSKNSFLLNPPKARPPETIGDLIIAATVACVAPACPLLTTVRPVVIPGKHARVEHYRKDLSPKGVTKRGHKGLESEMKPKTRRQRRNEIEKGMGKMPLRKHDGPFEDKREFVVNLAKALMKFGSPTHRIQSHVEQAGKSLGMKVTCLYLAVVCFIHIEHADSGSHELKFVREYLALDLDRSLDTHEIYLKVYRDKISPGKGLKELISLLKQPPRYKWWQVALWGSLSSGAICSLAFSGSFIDALVSFPLGFIVTSMAYVPENDLYANIYEVSASMLMAFIGSALAGTGKFCYSAVVTAAVVWLLPGFTIILGALEISSVQNMTTGAVRLCFAAVYAMTMGLGIAIGTNLYTVIDHKVVDVIVDYNCSSVHNPFGPWWQRPVPDWVGFITVPIFAISFLSRMHLTVKEKEFFVAIIIASSTWLLNYFLHHKLPNQPNISSAAAAFFVGITANIYGKYLHGSPYIVMVVAVMFIVPNMLIGGGLFYSVSEQIRGDPVTSYLDGFNIALKMISMAISLTVGFCLAIFVMHPKHVSTRTSGTAYAF